MVRIPEGARVQNDARAKASMVYFPYYFWDENGKAKAERDYIGTVVDGKFCPNAYYRENLPVHKKRPPERWRNARQRAKAEALEKAVADYLSSTDWFALELNSKDDITRQIAVRLGLPGVYGAVPTWAMRWFTIYVRSGKNLEYTDQLSRSSGFNA